MASDPRVTAMTTGRVEAFSDGVIAVAITLLVLDLRVPKASEHQALSHALAAQWPNYLAYVVSFLTIGVIWINHHAMLHRLERVDYSVLALNVLLLLTVVALPFSTALMAEYLTEPAGGHLAAFVYGGSFLLMALTFFVMQRHLLLRRTTLLKQQLDDRARRRLLRRNAAGLVPYAAATATAVLSQYVTVAICAAVAIFYALPSVSRDPS